ncbi:hypothetical protein EYB26_005869 [Talaromyces marneffei]|uniref:uncharacterized protein n=1 Tax=Talaromyces marneffei TaxID=37727 RepID=UPI0012AA769C|nr:uncharacterized protein EYB26_005869 [Talaromyces marneffei]QGA18185.1 hypothetical protein EYB26_005869 [Talaromyces marneffei]
MPPIRALDDWATSRAYTLALSSLKGTVIGIDATYYLYQHLHHPSTREPLLIALGGFPFALRANIERELKELKELGIGCIFVFDGLQFGVEDSQNRVRTDSRRADSARAFEQAWDLYDQQQADQVVDAFSNAGNPEPVEFYRFLQRILYENNIDFFVAPYSAAAQLKYFESTPKPFVDFVWGSTDVFLFDVEKVILKLDLDASQFLWMSKERCREELGRLTNEQFLEFGLLLGSRYLRTFPPFENSTFPGKPWNIRDALNIFNGANRHATTLCSQFEEDRRVQDLQYLDRYKRAYMSIKHHVTTDNEGRVGPLDPETAPSDVHELIGQRLPEELYYYISRGVLGSNIPNYLTTGQLTVPLPFGVEDSEVYRRLAGDSLMPIREQAVGLLSNSLHRFYQTKVINVRLWHEENSTRTINLKTLPSVRDSIRSWRISHKQLPSELANLETPRGSLKFAAESLTNSDFVSKTFSSKESVALSSEDEILHQTLLAFLQLRGYVNSKHELTDWGKCFVEAVKALDTAKAPVDSQTYESVFTAVEMLRMGVLGPSNWFPHHSGGPMRGSDEDKSFNLLISRVACIGKLKHKPIGYSGPLSRQLLSFRSLIFAVRRTLRELVEVVLTSMLLSGEVDRNIGSEGLTSISYKLPFVNDNDCGLGIAVRTYLDDLLYQPESSSPKTREEVRAKGKEWFQHSESFEDNLDAAFTLWDAVYAASQNAPKDFKTAKVWEDANKWLASHR